MKRLIALIVFVLLAGCAVYRPAPVLPGKHLSRFEERRLEASDLKKFLEQNLKREIVPWPPKSWDLNMLTLAAFYYNPDLEVSRAQWRIAQARIITAGQRPNPSLGMTPEYVSNAVTGISPWILSTVLEVPVQTAGKRGIRIEQARYQAGTARLNLASTAWKVRTRLRTSLVNFYVSRENLALIETRVALQDSILRLLRQRFLVGEISSPVLPQRKIALNQSILVLEDTRRQANQSRLKLANALGVTGEALENINFSFRNIKNLPDTKELSLPDLRRLALLNRADILAALQEYAAAEAALKLEVARQYPNISLGPGYSYDQGDNKWALGLSFSLPVLNRNRGPLAEAEARWQQAAANFNALQAQILNTIDVQRAAFFSSSRKLETADSLLHVQQGQSQSMKRLFQVGEGDRVQWLESQREYNAAAEARLQALAQAQRALTSLENALQHPLGGESPNPINLKLESNPRAETTGSEAGDPPGNPYAHQRKEGQP